MQENADKFPDKSLRVVKVLEDGDHVATFAAVRRAPGQSEVAVVHIFRFEDDRIAELWDVGQEVPRDSPNELGVF
jgi:predicted SnoaL-like aldol condensation-catalyzing enzyme